jgi:mannose-6-phosphate isomerase
MGFQAMAESQLYPLVFEPFLRPMPWGGERLADWIDMPLPPGKSIGEAWLLSDHALHASQVRNGPLAGRTLRELMTRRSADILGYKAERFPLLIKLLDAHENLSVQVHPDDMSAKQWVPGEGGKTEAWIVLAAEPDAAIYLGLKHGVDQTTLLRELASGNAALCLQQFRPKPGECYFVPAGTIHAIGGGLVVLEVQQTSDATFRLYDWGRTDETGKPRTLHLEAGLACLKTNLRSPEPIPPARHSGDELLVTCEHFGLRRRKLDRPVPLVGPSIQVILEGSAEVPGMAQLRHGSALLVPARCVSTQLVPSSAITLIEVTIPSEV